MPATKKQRMETGIKKGPNKGKYPLATKAQALSAIRLRHHGKGVSAKTVLDRVARSKWAKDPEVRRKLKAARAKDRQRGKA